jgi:serine/threonine protein phosphatase PrpC
MNAESHVSDPVVQSQPATGSFESPAGLPAVRVDAAARSHAGLVRPNNEDVYLVVRYGRYWETLATNLPPGDAPARVDSDGYGFLVADGVGGHAAGEVASRLAVDTLIRLALETPDWILLPPGDEDWKRIQERAREYYRQIDAALRAEAEERPELQGMGTTLTLARNVGRDLIVAHVGDSRAYRLRGDDFRQLTRDHTLAQELADARGISPGDVVKHLFRHVLTRALGGKIGWAGVDVGKFGLDDGDQVLVCSDGLTEMVAPAEIAGVLRSAPTAEATCQELVELALKAGGKDNVTVALARYQITGG